MRIRRDDLDEIDRPETVKTPDANVTLPRNEKKGRSSKSNGAGGRCETTAKTKQHKTKPINLTEQLKQCLGQYELLKKQVLCAELTQTSPPNQKEFQRAAQKLIMRITSLRQQLATKRSSASLTASTGTALTDGSVSKTDLSKQRISPAGRKLSATEKTTAAQRRRTVRLAVSGPTARILKAFADAGQSPSALIERAFWMDADVLDAALLLGVESPMR